jgi:hypothetical protein
MCEEECVEEDKEMKRKKSMHNNKIWKKQRNELSLGYWMYEEDEEEDKKWREKKCHFSVWPHHPTTCAANVLTLCVMCP